MGSQQVRGAEEFCHAVWPRLAASLGLYCNDAGVGEELAQEALVRAWARWDTVSDLACPESWVYSVGLNLARSRFRRARAERRAIGRLGPPRESPTTASATDAVAVRAAVAALPERQRAALVMRYFADLPVSDVAAAMDCADGTVRSLTSQAIERLRQGFEIELADEDLQ